MKKLPKISGQEQQVKCRLK